MCSFASRGRLHYIGFLLLVLLIGSQSSRAQASCVGGPADCGQWTPNVISLPIIPIAAALLPDGRVLGWSSNTLTTFENDIGATPSQTFTSLTTPQIDTSTLQSRQYPMTPDWGISERVTNPRTTCSAPGLPTFPMVSSW